jgi:RNA-directed DNA polymerase
VALCRTEVQAQAALAWLQATLGRLKLRLHPEKTRVVDLSQGEAGLTSWGSTFGEWHLGAIRAGATVSGGHHGEQ